MISVKIEVFEGSEQASSRSTRSSLYWERWGVVISTLQNYIIRWAYIDMYPLHSIELEENISKRSDIIHPLYKPAFFV